MIGCRYMHGEVIMDFTASVDSHRGRQIDIDWGHAQQKYVVQDAN